MTILDKVVDRKVLRYAELSEYIESSGYVYMVLPLQVGFPGFIDMNSFSPLQVLMKMKKVCLRFLPKGDCQGCHH